MTWIDVVELVIWPVLRGIGIGSIIYFAMKWYMERRRRKWLRQNMVEEHLQIRADEMPGLRFEASFTATKEEIGKYITRRIQEAGHNSIVSAVCEHCAKGIIMSTNAEEIPPEMLEKIKRCRDCGRLMKLEFKKK